MSASNPASQNQAASPAQSASQGQNGASTATPIKHVIVLIGENRSFDNAFATYRPKEGQSVANLLSKGIITASGAPGAHALDAMQFAVNMPLPSAYFISAPAKTPYSPFMPTPELNGAPNAPVSLAQLEGDPTSVQPPFDNSLSMQQLAQLEPSLEHADLDLLRTGATGAASTKGIDTRIRNAANLSNTSFQITGPSVPYDSYTGDSVHRLFHMWQQSDCDISNATAANPSGCLSDLYPFVAVARGDDSGANSMGFYSMAAGDVPVLKQLADEYTLADNFHQSAMGGTAGNHMTLGTGDSIAWDSFNGMTQPPANTIADPDPASTSSDAYKADKGWTNCSDTSQPGIAPIVNYLASLPWHPSPNCASGKFYMINNMSPGFLPNGQIDTAGITAGSKVPPSSLRTIGDALNEKKIPWAYYGGGYDAAVRVANGSKDPFDQLIAVNYCDICNFESYASSIMGDSSQRAAHIKDATDFFADLDEGTLPAVSFVKPDSFIDGHPASSKLDLFEGMVENIVDQLTAHPDRFKDTALFVVFDEGGGYWDSGFIQPLDFFGDGPRIPFLIVSPFSRGGKVVHTYYDHVSILKFIEKNWRLPPLTGRSRDNLPNPQMSEANAYVPRNMPAIGDLMEMFDFGDDQKQGDNDRDRDDRGRAAEDAMSRG